MKEESASIPGHLPAERANQLTEARMHIEALEREVESLRLERDRLRRIAAWQMRGNLTGIQGTRSPAAGDSGSEGPPPATVVDSANAANQELEALLHAVLASRSWRMSAPLRRWAAAVRRDHGGS